MSAPAFAAATAFASVTTFSSVVRRNFTFSGCGAPQFSQVFFEPLFLLSQLGHTHSSSMNPLDSLRISHSC
jgi:hypothetical protein